MSTHCHDDLGLAVANSLAGVANGARQVECAINGLGERAGNAALEEVVMAIRTRSDYFEGVGVNVKSDELARTSRLVSRLTGYHVQFNKAVVGRNAFAHEAGIHQHGVLADRETYEIIDASDVGQEAAQIVLGKHSGRHAFNDTLEKMGIHVQGDALNAAFVRFKELADKKIEITEADLEAIVAEELGIGMVHRFSVHELELRGGTDDQPTRARRRSTDGDGKIEATGSGDGMIDAAIAAISEATGVTGKRRQLPGVVGDRRFRRARRGGDHGRRRRAQGHRPRRRHRRRRGVGACVPQRGQQARAPPRARRRARSHRRAVGPSTRSRRERQPVAERRPRDHVPARSESLIPHRAEALRGAVRGRCPTRVDRVARPRHR